MTTPKALKDLLTALGGSGDPVKTVPALKAIYAQLGGGGEFPDTIPEAIEKIASVAGDAVSIKYKPVSATATVSTSVAMLFASKTDGGAVEGIALTSTAKTYYVPVIDDKAVCGLSYYSSNASYNVTVATSGVTNSAGSAVSEPGAPHGHIACYIGDEASITVARAAV